MTEHLHPQRATYPLVNTDDELVLVFRDHIVPGSPPVLYLKGRAATEAVIVDSRTLDDRTGLVVVDYSNGAGDTVTLNVDGTPTVITEGSEFNAFISNEETAIRIAAAINTAAVGLTATFEEGLPNVYVAPDAGVKEYSLVSGDVTAWTPDILATRSGLITVGKGETTEIELPASSTDPTKQVSFLKILSGRLAVDLRSPIEVRSYFRQPATLKATTGHPGGWPTSP